MFKLSAICIDTASQSSAPLSDGIVNHTLAELFPFLHNPLTQFTDILDYVVIYKEYIICSWIIVTLAIFTVIEQHLAEIKQIP